MPPLVPGFPVVVPFEADTSISATITVPAGRSNLVMVVTTSHENAGAGGQVSGITFNGDAFTNIGRAFASTWSRTEMWALRNPDVGTFTLAATKGSLGDNRWNITIWLLEDCDQTTTWRAPATRNANTGTGSSLTPAGVAATDSLIDSISIDSTGHNAVPGADQTERVDTDFGAGSNETHASTQAGSAGGVMSWTWTTSSPHSHLAVAFIQAPSSDTTPPTINVDSVTAGKISRIAGKDSADVTFTANESFVEFEVRRVSAPTDGRAAGSQVETAVVSARTSHTITITDDELVAAAGAEGNNLLKVFVKDAAGNWSS